MGFGKNAMKKSSVFVWCKKFKDGRKMANDPRSRLLKVTIMEINATRVRDADRSDRRLNVSAIAEKLQINRDVIRVNLTEERFLQSL